jgi:flagellar hook protein FlgE
MSLFGAMTTAVSGLTAQSRALGHVSDNVANSQTVGFKRVDTNFVDYLTRSTLDAHSPGSVLARPDYTNSVQGTIEQSEDPLALAIGGQGFFNVAAATGTVNNLPVFDQRQLYTRAGDFRMDANGYLVNGPGYFLQGWTPDATGEPDRTTVAPIRLTQQFFSPIATTELVLAANLPTTAPATPISAQMQVYDALGAQHFVNLNFTRTTGNVWSMAIVVPDDVTATARGSAEIRFGAGGPPVVPAAADGTIAGFGPTTGFVSAPAAVPGDPARVTFTADFGQGAQTIALNLGTFGEATGLTQFAATAFTVRNQTQNGVPLGSYAGLTIRTNGDVAVNYDNGQSRVFARVPLVAFSDPDKLQRLDGQAFMRTVESGEARVTDAASNGVGKLVTGAIERSNVDIASEFTKLIVAQRAYTANTRIVTAADELLQETINLRR